MAKKTVIVTVAASGIGRATALQFASRGWQVFATARDPRKIDYAGSDITALPLDVTSEPSISAAVDEVRSRVGRIDVLINNAGYGIFGAVEQTSLDEFRQLFETNVFGAIACAKAVLDAMHQQGKGKIINISSIAGKIAPPFSGAYAASKFALEGVSDSMRVELKPFGIHVVLIQPGPVRTNFSTAQRTMESCFDDQSRYASYFGVYDRMEDERLTERMERTAAAPEEVADVVYYAATRRTPHPRYVAPVRYSPLLRLLRMAPTRLVDAIQSQIIGYARNKLVDIATVKGWLPDLLKSLSQAASRDGQQPYITALVTATQGSNVTVNDREQSVTARDSSTGLVLRAFNGLYFEEYSTTSLTADAVLREGREWLATLHLHQQPHPGAAPFTALPPLVCDFVMPARLPVGSVDLRDSLAQMQAIHRLVSGSERERVRGEARIANVQIVYSEEISQRIFAAPGRLLTQLVPRSRYYVNIYATDGEQVRSAYYITAKTVGYELVEDSDWDLAALREEAFALLAAQPIPPGEYDIIGGPEVTGVLAHESFGHGVETDMFMKERARSAHYIGKQLAAANVNLLDDPTYPTGNGSYFFDDEGLLAEPTYVIRNGIFERGITDAYSAMRLGLARSANGRRESFMRKAYARMSNTYFAAGDQPAQAIIGAVERGVYLPQMESGMEDPKNWGIQIIPSFGREIRDGKLTNTYYSPIGMTGYVPDVLASISMVGDDVSLAEGGSCGKGHKEWVPVASGGPTMRFRARLSLRSEGLDDILEQAAATLRQQGGADEWAIRRTRSRSTQLFTVGTEPEAMRHNLTDRLNIDLFVDHDGRRGESAFVVNTGDLAALREAAEQAIFGAGLAGNAPYRLPAATTYPQLELVDEQIAANPAGLAGQIVNEVAAAVAASEGTRLSAIEIFLNYNEHSLLTSTGAQGSYAATTVTLDLTLLTGPQGEDAESQLLTSRRRLADLPVAELVRAQAQYSADSLRAGLPQTGRWPVIFSEVALEDLFDPFLYRSSAAAKYRSLSPLSVGERIIVGQQHGTPLTLVSDATLPYGLLSQPFDDLGIPSQRLVLIEGDVLRQFSAGQRYASYLNLAASGPRGNTVLPAGDTAASDLLRPSSGLAYQVISFSAFAPDPISGDFVAEIRLGYEWRPDGSKRPIRGGAVSGNIFANFASATYSRETTFNGSYSGPAYIRLEDLTIAGS